MIFRAARSGLTISKKLTAFTSILLPAKADPHGCRSRMHTRARWGLGHNGPTGAPATRDRHAGLQAIDLGYCGPTPGCVEADGLRAEPAAPESRPLREGRRDWVSRRTGQGAATPTRLPRCAAEGFVAREPARAGTPGRAGLYPRPSRYPKHEVTQRLPAMTSSTPSARPPTRSPTGSRPGADRSPPPRSPRQISRSAAPRYGRVRRTMSLRPSRFPHPRPARAPAPPARRPLPALRGWWPGSSPSFEPTLLGSALR
jgi:hypothetical protein